MKRKVIILGGGLSALSTGIHLLEDGGAAKYDVKILCMEHRLGGKAASWRKPDGRFMEIGFHAIFGYYRAIRGLLAKVGRPVTDTRWFSSNHGIHLMYEASARAVNRLHLPNGISDIEAILNNGFVDYQGMNVLEKMRAARFFAEALPRLFLDPLAPEIDEQSFTAFCVSMGLDISLTQKSWFRYVLDLAFNYPNEGSAFVGARGFRALVGYENSEVFYFNGPMSEIMIAPLAEYFTALGGTIEFCTKVTGITLDPSSRRITKLSTQAMATPIPIPGVVDHVDWAPIGGSYSLEDDPYPHKGDPKPGEGAPVHELTLGADFDEVVWTLPVDSTKALLRTTPSFEEAVMESPKLSRVFYLRTVAPISMRIWLPNKVMPADFDTVVMGTPQPAATIIDYANRVEELRRGPYGSVIEFEGQEGLHADFTDREMQRVLLEQFAELPFVDSGRFSIDDVLEGRNGCHLELRRNTANHLRYLLMEPGHWKYRYEQEDSGYENLVFAGDWMQGTQPTASMEAATRTGKVAANHLRYKAGLAPAAD